MDSACDRFDSVRNAQIVGTNGGGFAGSARQELKDLVSKLAAACCRRNCYYSGALNNGQTTHLIYRDRSDVVASEKYQKAKQWNIPVLSLSWLKDSAHAGKLLPLNDYFYHPPLAVAGKQPLISASNTSGFPSYAAASHLSNHETTFPIDSVLPTQSASASIPGPTHSANPGVTKSQTRRTNPIAAADSVRASRLHEDTSGTTDNFNGAQSRKRHLRLPPEVVIPEPERQRAAALQLPAFGLDSLQELHSPGSFIRSPTALLKNVTVRKSTRNKSSTWSKASPTVNTIRELSTAVRLSPRALSRNQQQQQQQSPTLHSIPPVIRNSPGSCCTSQPCKAPHFSTARGFHALRNTSALQYFNCLQVPQDGDSDADCLQFEVPDRAHGALLYTADGLLGAHVLSYADLLAVYELRGVVWIEHLYYYDEEDIRIDSRRQGPHFLQQHSMRPTELVACPFVHHSRAAAIEGHFRLYDSEQEVRVAAGAAKDSGENMPAMFNTCSWNPDTGDLIPGTLVGEEASMKPGVVRGIDQRARGIRKRSRGDVS